jgi:hypothetical protein
MYWDCNGFQVLCLSNVVLWFNTPIGRVVSCSADLALKIEAIHSSGTRYNKSRKVSHPRKLHILLSPLRKPQTLLLELYLTYVHS